MNTYTNEEYKILIQIFKEKENTKDFFYFMSRSYIDKAIEAILKNEDPTEHFIEALPEKAFNAMYYDPKEKIPIYLSDNKTSFLKTIVTWRCEIGK